MPVEKAQFFDPTPTTQINTGEAQQWGDLSARLDRFQNQVVDRKARQNAQTRRDELALYEAETSLDILAQADQIEQDVFVRSSDPQDISRELNPIEMFDLRWKANTKKWLDSAPAELRPSIELFAYRQGAPIRDRVVTKFQTEQRDNARSSTFLGLEKLVDDASRKLANGEFDAAQADMDMFETITQNGFQSGLLGGQDDIKTIQAAQARAREATIIGEFELALDGGDPVKYIQDFADKVPEGMSQEEHSSVWGKLETRLSRHNKHQEDADAAADAEREARHEAGKRDVGLRMLKGEDVDLAAEVEADNIDVDWAIKQEQRAAVRGPAYDNEQVAAFYKLDLLTWTEEEILEDNDLTMETRAALVEERRALLEDMGDWRNSNPGKEALRRVKNAVGIPEGIIIAEMKSGLVRDVGEALTELYDEVESLPVEKRTSEVLAVADKIVKRVDRRRAADDLIDAEEKLAQAEDEAATKTGAQQEVALKRVERWKREIAKLEKRLTGE